MKIKITNSINIVLHCIADYDSKGNLLGVEINNLFETLRENKIDTQKPNNTNSMLRFFKSFFTGSEYDSVADAAYMKTRRGKPYKQVEVNKPVIVDLDKKGRVVGIEVLGINRKIPYKS